jgi:hypothetical protein
VKTYTEWHFIDGVDLIFHEAGHTIFSFFGEFIGIASGSGFQVLLPILIALHFYRSGQKISGDIALLWVGQNLLNVSVSAGDAVSMRLDLLGGDGVIHDWHYLLSSMGLLEYTHAIAMGIWSIGFLAIVLGTTLALYRAWTYNTFTGNI